MSTVGVRAIEKDRGDIVLAGGAASVSIIQHSASPDLWKINTYDTQNKKKQNNNFINQIINLDPP